MEYPMKISKFASPLVLPFIMIATVASAQESMPDKQAMPNQQAMPDKSAMPGDPMTPENPTPSNEAAMPEMQKPSASDQMATTTPDRNSAPTSVVTGQSTYPPCSATVQDQCMQGPKRKMMRKKPRSQ
jgi:cytoskeletal protein RodZ